MKTQTYFTSFSKLKISTQLHWRRIFMIIKVRERNRVMTTMHLLKRVLLSYRCLQECVWWQCCGTLWYGESIMLKPPTPPVPRPSWTAAAVDWHSLRMMDLHKRSLLLTAPMQGSVQLQCYRLSQASECTCDAICEWWVLWCGCNVCEVYVCLYEVICL